MKYETKRIVRKYVKPIVTATIVTALIAYYGIHKPMRAITNTYKDMSKNVSTLTTSLKEYRPVLEKVTKVQKLKSELKENLDSILVK